MGGASGCEVEDGNEHGQPDVGPCNMHVVGDVMLEFLKTFIEGLPE